MYVAYFDNNIVYFKYPCLFHDQLNAFNPL